MSEQNAVLEYLASHTLPHGEMCHSFAPIMRATGLARQRTRFLVRLLARKGLAEFHQGLFNEDGELAGSGYCITPAGREAVRAMIGRGE